MRIRKFATMSLAVLSVAALASLGRHQVGTRYRWARTAVHESDRP